MCPRRIPTASTHFSTTKAAFDPALWDRGEHHTAKQNPGDNPGKFRTIVALLKP
jgi:hypothetical protein